MQCCPLSGADDGESATLSRDRVLVARKEHVCGECDEPIPVGAKYERTDGLWDGSWSTYKTCLSCVEIRNHFSCEGWLFGAVWDDLEQNFFPTMKAGGPCMEGLSPEAKARLFERRTKWFEELPPTLRARVLAAASAPPPTPPPPRLRDDLMGDEKGWGRDG